MTGDCPSCGAKALELSSLYKGRKFEVPICWCCRMRRHNQIREGFDPFETKPDGLTLEMVSAFSASAERQIARDDRQAIRRATQHTWIEHTAPAE